MNTEVSAKAYNLQNMKQNSSLRKKRTTLSKNDVLYNYNYIIIV